MSGAPALRSLCQSSSKFLDVGVLNSRIFLRIHYKLSLVYFDTEKVAEVGPELERPTKRLRKLLDKRPRRAKDPTSLLSILEAMDMSLKSFDRVTEACSL